MAKTSNQAEVRRAVEEALNSGCTDDELLLRLEMLAQKHPLDFRLFSGWRKPGLFRAEMALWAPALYHRNRVKFRPFILSQYSNYELYLAYGKSWQSDTRSLEQWRREAEENDDAVVHRLVYGLLLEIHGKRAEEVWRAALRERFLEARSAGERQSVLDRFALHYRLDEETALALYEVEPKIVTHFIKERLPHRFAAISGREARKPWTRLMDAAGRRKDETLYYVLYRRQTPVEVWKKDVERLAMQVQDPAELNRILKLHHIESWDADIGPTLLSVLEKRGRDVFPYLRQHLRSAFGHHVWGGRKSWYKELVELARRREWWDVLGATIRLCGPPADFDSEVAALVAQGPLSEEERRYRLSQLAGVSREWHFPGFSIHQAVRLGEVTAISLYNRFPDLARGPFRQHLTPYQGKLYLELRALLIERGDIEMIDHFAAKMVIDVPWSLFGSLERHYMEFARYYEQMKFDSPEFLRRAGNVLSKLPAYAIWDFDRLVDKNPMARLFFTRSTSRFLDDTIVVRDLLESPQIHVQILGLRALALDDHRAVTIGADCADLLAAFFTRPLLRTTRLLAFKAIRNAASSSAAVAARLLRAAREAMDLPDEKYPKEHLVGVIAAILHQWPELRQGSEVPTVYTGRTR